MSVPKHSSHVHSQVLPICSSMFSSDYYAGLCDSMTAMLHCCEASLLLELPPLRSHIPWRWPAVFQRSVSWCTDGDLCCPLLVSSRSLWLGGDVAAHQLGSVRGHGLPDIPLYLESLCITTVGLRWEPWEPRETEDKERKRSKTHV